MCSKWKFNCTIEEVAEGCLACHLDHCCINSISFALLSLVSIRNQEKKRGGGLVFRSFVMAHIN